MRGPFAKLIATLHGENSFGQEMRRILPALLLNVLLPGCAFSHKYDLIKLPDGTKLQAIQYESIRLIGTDLSYLVLYECSNLPTGMVCSKVGEAAGR